MKEIDFLKERVVAMELIVDAMHDDHIHIMKTVKILSFSVFTLALSVIAVNFNLWRM